MTSHFCGGVRGGVAQFAQGGRRLFSDRETRNGVTVWVWVQCDSVARATDPGGVS